FSVVLPPPGPTPFPYPTLFRSLLARHGKATAIACRHEGSPAAFVPEHIEDTGRRGDGRHAKGLVDPAAQLALLEEFLKRIPRRQDRKSTRLNSSHVKISYAVFC